MNTFHYSTACRQILGDLYTPVSTYLKVRDLYPQSALMESSDYHSHDNSRSFIALNPIASIDISHGTVTAQYPDGTQESREINENYPAEQAFNDFLSRFTVTGDKQEFCGLYGYTSFNAVRYFEHIEIKDCMQEKNDAPDILYILYKYVIAFDHFNNTMTLIELVENHEPDTLDELERVIQNHNFATYDFRPIGETFSTLTDDEHKANIRQGIAHCLRGDVFQIVLSRRFVQRYEGDDFKLYRALRSINPSPYLFYFDFGGFRIFGSSPETHCRIEGRHAYIDPIAGTTKRTGNADTDAQNANYLKNDPKENAIQGECEISLLKERSTGEYIEALQRISSESKRISNLIRHLLFLSRQDEELLKSNMEAVSLPDMLNDLIKTNERIRFHHEETGKAATVKANPYLLKIALKNIIDNACKYSEKE